MIKFVLPLSAVLLIASCDKRLDEVTVKNSEVEVTKYSVSEITSMHDFIEVKKGDKVIKVAEANTFGFADILFKHDTIVIQYLPSVFYSFSDRAFNYKIELDTAISPDYWRQRVKKREEAK